MSQLDLQSMHTFAFHSKGDEHKSPLIPQLPQNTNTPPDLWARLQLETEKKLLRPNKQTNP